MLNRDVAENDSRAAGGIRVSGEDGLLLDGEGWEEEELLMTNARMPLVMLFDALCVFLLRDCDAGPALRSRVTAES